TLLNQVTASTTAITSGGIAFRGNGSDKYFDTVTAAYGVNAFAVQASSPSSGTASPSWADNGREFDPTLGLGRASFGSASGTATQTPRDTGTSSGPSAPAGSWLQQSAIDDYFAS